jgi:hypothetical protein
MNASLAPTRYIPCATETHTEKFNENNQRPSEADQQEYAMDILEQDIPLGICLHCGGSFEAKRRTKRYCTDKCRQYGNRTTQNAKESPTKQREQLEYYDRVNYALELYMASPLELSNDWLQCYIDNPTTKKIACNPVLLRDEHINIAKICHNYVMETYGVSIKDYYYHG